VDQDDRAACRRSVHHSPFGLLGRAGLAGRNQIRLYVRPDRQTAHQVVQISRDALRKRTFAVGISSRPRRSVKPPLLIALSSAA
jgi:hypothetical protein